MVGGLVFGGFNKTQTWIGSSAAGSLFISKSIESNNLNMKWEKELKNLKKRFKILCEDFKLKNLPMQFLDHRIETNYIITTLTILL